MDAFSQSGAVRTVRETQAQMRLPAIAGQGCSQQGRGAIVHC
jgi:hypothetical protein